MTRCDAAHLLHGLEDILLGDADRGQDVLRPALDLGQGEQQVLDRDVLVLHPVGLGLRRLEDAVELGPERRLPAGDLGQGVEPLLGRPQDLRRVAPELTQHRPHDRLLRVEQGHQQVDRLQPLMTPLLGQSLGLLQGLLALQRQLLESKGHECLRRLSLGRDGVAVIVSPAPRSWYSRITPLLVLLVIRRR